MAAATADPPGGGATGPAAALRHEGARIRLRGRPGDLLGIVEMERTAAPEVGAEIAATEIARPARGHRLRYAPVLKSTLPAATRKTQRLRFLNTPEAGASGKAPVRFIVAAETPPGSYEVVFDVAGAARVADVEVLADPRLEIEPSRVVLSGPPGGVVVERLILTNAGNVPLELDVLGVLVLEEEEQVCLSLQRALGRVKAELKPDTRNEGAHRTFLDALVQSLAERTTDFGRVRIAGGPLRLERGAVEAADVAFHLPRDMVAGRRYHALMKSGAARLFVTIVAETDGGATPRRRTRAAAG